MIVFFIYKNSRNNGTWKSSGILINVTFLEVFFFLSKSRNSSYTKRGKTFSMTEHTNDSIRDEITRDNGNSLPVTRKIEQPIEK